MIFNEKVVNLKRVEKFVLQKEGVLAYLLYRIFRNLAYGAKKK